MFGGIYLFKHALPVHPNCQWVELVGRHVWHISISCFHFFLLKASTPGTSRSELSSTHESYESHRDKRRHSVDKYHRYGRDEYEGSRRDKSYGAEYGEKRTRHGRTTTRTPGMHFCFYHKTSLRNYTFRVSSSKGALQLFSNSSLVLISCYFQLDLIGMMEGGSGKTLHVGIASQ